MTHSRSRRSRRQFLKLTGVTATAAGIAGCLGEDADGEGKDVNADEFPSGDITSIANAEGGGFDQYSRIAAPFWEEHLPDNPNVVVENIPGGGGLNAFTELYRSDPNGHTFGIWDVHHATTNQVGRDVEYDVEEMSYIGAITQSPWSIIVTEESGIETWDDLREQITDHAIATAGAGAMPHTSWLLLTELTEFPASPEDLQFIHYEGSGDVVAAMERGEADLFMVSSSSGKKVAEATGGSMLVSFAESADTPAGEYFEDVAMNYTPDIDEEGIERFQEVAVFRRFFAAPPSVPDDIMKILHESFLEFVQSDDFVQEAEEGGRPVINPGEHEQVEEDVAKTMDHLRDDPIRSLLQENM